MPHLHLQNVLMRNRDLFFFGLKYIIREKLEPSEGFTVPAFSGSSI